MPSTTYQLRIIEQHACHAFAKHLATCDICTAKANLSARMHTLCGEAIRLRDNHTEAARDYAKVDNDFARRHTLLIA